MKKLTQLLSKIKMGCLTQALIIELAYSKLWLKPLAILYKEGYIQNYIIKNSKIFIYLRYY